MIYEFLAQGFEEIEAVTPLDLLRRAGKEVITVGVNSNEITGRSNIKITADAEISEISLNKNVEMIVLPGGAPGYENLYASEKVREAVTFCAENDIYIAAICGAPTILGRMGLLKGITAVCYPGCEDYLEGAVICGKSVVADGKIITAKGAGVSLQFGLKLVETLCDSAAAEELSKALQCD